MILFALLIIISGTYLLLLHGSSYYFWSGMCLLIAGKSLLQRRFSAVIWFAVVVLITIVWTVMEGALSYWQIVPRFGIYTLMAVGLLLLSPFLTKHEQANLSLPARLLAPPSVTKAWIAAACVLLSIVGMALFAFQPHDVVINRANSAGWISPTSTVSEDWRSYGRTEAGTRFVNASQINSANVRQLKIAWVFRTGDTPFAPAEDQNTPLMVRDIVYICTVHDRVFALDADTGNQRWAFDASVRGRKVNKCTALAYFEPGTRLCYPHWGQKTV